MKFALNGALTIGTLDGANIEIREEVGAENFFLFGLTAEQVRDCRRAGYRPRTSTSRTPTLREVLDFIASGALAGGDREPVPPAASTACSAARPVPACSPTTRPMSSARSR